MTSSPAPPERIHRYPCPACGADLLYEPHDGFLSCSHCGHKEAIPTSAEQVEERSFEQYLQIRPDQLERLAANALDVKCQSCGATVTFTPPEVARQCDFCGVQIVAQAKSADPILAPGGVLPFCITQPDATASLGQWLKSRWFAPNALKHFARPDSIHGVYLPFWTYDTNTTSYYTGERGEHYYVTETYYTTDAQGKQVAQTRQVRHTRWYPASGTVARWFDDVLVPATLSLPQNRLEALEPWDFAELKAYDPAFLSGFKAQRYQVELAEGFERVKQVSANVIRGDVLRTSAETSKELTTSPPTIPASPSNTCCCRCMPALIANQKLYQIVVNGRTGESRVSGRQFLEDRL